MAVKRQRFEFSGRWLRRRRTKAKAGIPARTRAWFAVKIKGRAKPTIFVLTASDPGRVLWTRAKPGAADRVSVEIE
jgi:hypothetical protein